MTATITVDIGDLERLLRAIEVGDVHETDAIAVTLTDARGGRVRLHLGSDMAERLRERISAALDKRSGP